MVQDSSLLTRACSASRREFNSNHSQPSSSAEPETAMVGHYLPTQSSSLGAMATPGSKGKAKLTDDEDVVLFTDDFTCDNSSVESETEVRSPNSSVAEDVIVTEDFTSSSPEKSITSDHRNLHSPSTSPTPIAGLFRSRYAPTSEDNQRPQPSHSNSDNRVVPVVNALTVNAAASGFASRLTPYVDLAFIKSTMVIPSNEQYPAAPPALFDYSQPKQQLETLRSISQGYIRTRIDKVSLPQHANGLTTRSFRSVVSASMKHFPVISANGDGTTRDEATQHASAHFFAKLHKEGLLAQLLPYLTLERVDTNVVNLNSHTPTYVYEYASQFGLLPRVNHRHFCSVYIPQILISVFLVSIELDKLNIRSQARASTYREALILASIDFMAIAARMEAPPSIAIAVKDAESMVKARLGGGKKRGPKVETIHRPDISASHAQVIFRGRRIGEDVLMPSQTMATQVAWLTAVVAEKISLDDPLSRARTGPASQAAQLSSRRQEIYPHPLSIETYELATDTIRNIGQLDEPPEWKPEAKKTDSDRDSSYRRQLTPNELDSRNQDLVAHQKNQERVAGNVPKWADIKKSRAQLTINQYSAEVLDMVSNNECSILISGTGSGKTTQLPQLLLEDAIEKGAGAHCNIICTQPRQMAALSVARRVSVERNDGALKSVGHHVRFQYSPPNPGGSILYCTTGILLQQMQHSPITALDNISHIIVDETHERDLNIDSLLALLKMELRSRKFAGLKCPKVILASATLDVDLFSKYFMQTDASGRQLPCPSLSIPGRVYHVEQYYLADIMRRLDKYPEREKMLLTRDKKTAKYLQSELAMSNSSLVKEQTEEEEALVPAGLVVLTLAHIVTNTTEGAILVFLPGMDSLTKVNKLMTSDPPLDVNFDDDSKYKVMMLHGELHDAQTEVFEPVPRGCRKIILSTNVAETSVTIPEVQYVVDTGKHKKKIYDEKKGLTQLKQCWISRSSAKQRAGRAGRVQNGHCYSLYTEERAAKFIPNDLAEVLCSDLQEVCLTVASLTHSYKLAIRDFLETWVEPPKPDSVQASMAALKDMGALTEDEQITALGRVLASLPVHPSLGKMIILGIIFRCLDPMIILAASSAMKDMFVRPINARKEAFEARLNFSGTSNSDQLAVVNAFDKARTAGEDTGEYHARKWMESQFMHFSTFRSIYRVAEQIEQVLVDQRLMPCTVVAAGYWKFGPKELNTNSNNEALVKAVMLAGYHPNIAASFSPKLFRTLRVESATLMPQSVNNVAKREKRSFGNLYTFSELSKSTEGNQYMLRNSTAISPLTAILFGRNLDQDNNLLTVDGWLRFREESNHTADVLTEMKSALDNMLGHAYLELHTKPAGERYLHADPLREKFASQLGKLLDMDMQHYTEFLDQAASVQDNGGNGGGGGGGSGSGSGFSRRAYLNY